MLCRAYPWSPWARSSAVEHYLDTVGVTGSIPVAPTRFLNHLVAPGEPASRASCGGTLMRDCNPAQAPQRRAPGCESLGPMLTHAGWRPIPGACPSLTFEPGWPSCCGGLQACPGKANNDEPGFGATTAAKPAILLPSNSSWLMRQCRHVAPVAAPRFHALRSTLPLRITFTQASTTIGS
jgi:hypothetical protein